MEKTELQKVLLKAAQERGLEIVGLKFDDDDNVFEVTVNREGGSVTLEDCEYVHRAVLSAFDRNVEDYALTVSSLGMDPSEADEMLKTINE